MAESGEYFKHERIIRVDEVRRMKLPVFRICGQKKVHRTDVTLAMIKLMVGKTWLERLSANNKWAARISAIVSTGATWADGQGETTVGLAFPDAQGNDMGFWYLY